MMLSGKLRAALGALMLVPSILAAQSPGETLERAAFRPFPPEVYAQWAALRSAA